MRILGLKPGHDGAAALVDAGRLVFSFEAEKDSFPRHSHLSVSTLLAALEACDGDIDVLAVGGWHKMVGDYNVGECSGYFGLKAPELRAGSVFGHQLQIATSSHERSHLFMAAAMSTDAPLEDCVILVWEGVIGAFYRWSRGGRDIKRIPVMKEPGARYSALYALADPGFPDQGASPQAEYAGKLMALAGMASPADGVGGEERHVVDYLLRVPTLYPFHKGSLRRSAIYNVGPDTPVVHRAARLLTTSLYERFATVARTLPRGFPLLIAGGCALNCDWNRRWYESQLFAGVEAFPCANDSGSAIGTAIDAATQLGGVAKVGWSVYSGQTFVMDGTTAGWDRSPLDYSVVAAEIEAGAIIPWVEGRCEIGPRALGHRSLLASPLLRDSRGRLNAIKGREAYRPVAPCCLVEEWSRWFDGGPQDPFMLFGASVISDALPAVTHRDGTARVQSVDRDGPAGLRRILEAFRMRTGFGVLCNTSLNYPGAGFINRRSDLLRFAEQADIRLVVIEEEVYRRGTQ